MADREATKTRGVFERPPGSGVWWIQYFDHGRRQKVVLTLGGSPSLQPGSLLRYLEAIRA